MMDTLFLGIFRFRMDTYILRFTGERDAIRSIYIHAERKKKEEEWFAFYRCSEGGFYLLCRKQGSGSLLNKI